jgi:hypothetical protein
LKKVFELKKKEEKKPVAKRTHQVLRLSKTARQYGCWREIDVSLCI